VCCVFGECFLAMRLAYKQPSFSRYAYAGEDQCLSPLSQLSKRRFQAPRPCSRLLTACLQTPHADPHPIPTAAVVELSRGRGNVGDAAGSVRALPISSCRGFLVLLPQLANLRGCCRIGGFFFFSLLFSSGALAGWGSFKILFAVAVTVRSSRHSALSSSLT